MSTFQAIVFAVLRGFTEFLPVSASAHSLLVPYLLGWQEPSWVFQGALSLGAFLAVLVYFRHDWASTTAGFLSMILRRKRPRILDEWMMIFLALSTAPIAIVWYYAHEAIENFTWEPWLVAAILGVASVFLIMGESFCRNKKSMFDWNWLDALIVGILQIGGLIPGLGLMLGSVTAGLFRNYTREAIVKYSLFATAPILGASAWLRLHGQGISLHSRMPIEGVSWLTFITTVVVTFLFGLLAIGGLMKEVERKSFHPYAFYRIVVAIAVGGFYYWKSRSG